MSLRVLTADLVLTGDGPEYGGGAVRDGAVGEGAVGNGTAFGEGAAFGGGAVRDGAVLIDGGRIADVGPRQEVLDRAPAGTEVVPLGAATILPDRPAIDWTNPPP